MQSAANDANFRPVFHPHRRFDLDGFGIGGEDAPVFRHQGPTGVEFADATRHRIVQGLVFLPSHRSLAKPDVTIWIALCFTLLLRCLRTLGSPTGTKGA
jgi:hypothetical protein